MRAIWSWAALAALGLAPPAWPAEAGSDKPKSHEVPYRLTIPKHVLVRAKINGKGPFNFILDTGAPALFIATAAGKKAGLKPDRNGWATVDRFVIEGGVVLKKMRARVETPFQLEGMNGMGLAGAEVHGLIGYDILARYRMTIDFTRDKLIWVPLAHKPPPFLGKDRKSGGQGGMEVFGSIMKVLGRFLGRKHTPDISLRGFLGVTLVEGDEFPVVKAVLARGPAGRAGLKVGDQISRLAGRGVYTPEDVARRALQLRPGATVELTVLRGKETKRIIVKVGEGI
jgi:hypothetical protein